MFIIIILILVVDSVMLGIFAVQCNRSAAEYLIPMYLLQLIGYAALYRIYLKMKVHYVPFLPRDHIADISEYPYPVRFYLYRISYELPTRCNNVPP